MTFNTDFNKVFKDNKKKLVGNALIVGGIVTATVLTVYLTLQLKDDSETELTLEDDSWNEEAYEKWESLTQVVIDEFNKWFEENKEKA